MGIFLRETCGCAGNTIDSKSKEFRIYAVFLASSSHGRGLRASKSRILSFLVVLKYVDPTQTLKGSELDLNIVGPNELFKYWCIAVQF